MTQYAELHCKTNFSFLEGASHADELCQRAAQLGYAALAVVDRHSLSGIVRAHMAAASHQLKLIVGAEIHPRDAPPTVLWVTDRESYGRLARLLTIGRRRAAKGECLIDFDDIAEHSVGLLAGCLVVDGACRNSDSSYGAYRDVFGDRCYLLASLHLGPDDARKLAHRVALSQTTGIPLAAAGDVRYHAACRKPLYDALTAIRHGVSIDMAGALIDPNAQRHLKSIAELERLFAAAPGAMERTLELANRCMFSLEELRYEYPSELALIDQQEDDSWLPPPAMPTQQDSTETISPQSYAPLPARPLLACLQRLTERGAAARYPAGVPLKVRRLLDHELELIGQLHYEAYFLTVWDLVRFARTRGILCQGRGSAANSAVCFCLGVTSVDPARLDVLFERFVSRERDEAPDIDIDFEHERREEVLQYLYDKYGRERAGMTAEAITYRPRSAVRDLGKALGLSLDRIDVLAKNLEGYRSEPQLAERCRQSGIDPDSDRGRLLVQLVDELIGFPRHLSQHVGGMVITDRPLCELVPIENAAMADRTVIAWDKNDLDALGILKVDCLALGMLTAIRKAFQYVDAWEQRPEASQLALASVPPDDAAVYDMLCEADTMGVFQIESRAQMSMLPRLRPRTFYDLVIEVAIVRPGPIQGEMVHPYLRRRNGEEPIEYPNDQVREVLEKTLGVPLFQEQAMRLAVVAAGFTPGEADQLRRAMGAWRKTGVIDKFRIQMLQGMRERGLSDEFAERLFNQLRGFGEYGFPESHAASFAMLVYVSAWLKRHYPAPFTAALLNSQPMGFYAPAQLVRNLREHGGEVLPVDVNHSDWDCTLEAGLALRLGFRMLAGLREAEARKIEDARRDGAFTSVDNLTRRTRLDHTSVKLLADADAFASLEIDRRAALWDAIDQPFSPERQPLFADLAFSDCDADAEPLTPLPLLSDEEQVGADYRTAGLSLRAHPLTFFRSQLDRLGVTRASSLAEWENNKPICVAGLVLMRQRPSTAKGITFVTLEDESGVANLVIRVQVWERFYQIARRSTAMIATGILERKGSVIHVVVRRLQDLSAEIDRQAAMERLGARSRDFR